LGGVWWRAFPEQRRVTRWRWTTGQERRRCPPTQRRKGGCGARLETTSRGDLAGRVPSVRSFGPPWPATKAKRAWAARRRARRRKSDRCAWLKRTVANRGGDGWTWLGDTVARWERDGDGVFLRAMAAFSRRRPSVARPASAPLSPPRRARRGATGRNRPEGARAKPERLPGREATRGEN